MKLATRISLICVAISSANLFTTAAEIPTSAQSWSDLFDQSRRDARPVPTDFVERARTAALQELQTFNHCLTESGADAQKSWHDLLQWDTLQTAVEAAPTNETASLLERTYRQLRVDADGMEDSRVLRLRHALSHYLNVLNGRDDDPTTAVERRLDRLQSLLGTYHQSLDASVAAEVGELLAWLETHGEASKLVTAIRANWSHPNLVLRVSHGFAAPYVHKLISERQYQVNTIMGTVTRGPTKTDGAVDLEFVPNSTEPMLRLRFLGKTVATNQVGYKGPATIYSSAVTNIDAMKRIRIDPVKGLVIEACDANCRTNAHVSHVEAQPKVLKLLLKPTYNKVARKKVAESQHAGELEAARIVAGKVRKQLDAEAAEAIHDIEHGFTRYLITGPLRLDESPWLGGSTTESIFELQMRQARRHQIGAPNPRPDMSDRNAISVQLHESLFNNISARYLFQDPTQTDEKIEALAKFLAGEVPLALRVFSNSEPWSFTYDAERPLDVRFNGGAIRLTLRTVRWDVGEERFETPVNITVVYRPIITHFGPGFERQGDLLIQTADGRSLDPQWLAFAEPKLHALLPEKVRFNNLVAPQGGSFGNLANLLLTDLRCDDGWISVGYIEKPAIPATSQTTQVQLNKPGR